MIQLRFEKPNLFNLTLHNNNKMRKFRSKFLTLILFGFLINSIPNFTIAQSSLIKNSWQENFFFTNQQFQWQYQDVSFNGAIEIVCPCENDTTIIIIKKDLAELNLVTEDINEINEFFDHFISTQKFIYAIENSTLILDLEGIPFIYPVIREYANGTQINWLEQLAINNPTTNYTDFLYVTRKIENGVYIQRKVFSFNPWFRFETKIDIHSGVLQSLWFEEGFFSLTDSSFSHIYNLTLISDIPEPSIQVSSDLQDQLSSSKNNDANFNTISTYIALFAFIPIIYYRFLKRYKLND
ncbi:MAG: hypothetical protein HeimC2_44500 [Candidatus Heimdallarchaeota archaeon LC_2]|nr:MAG: hypothetical protein HeimC2_44500 [Candidatus Heimdallarchaeota archaeon LC_2]